jgi:hypothetical protein
MYVDFLFCVNISLVSRAGTQRELGMPPTNKTEEMKVGENSTCVLGQPNERNFVNLFAAVECK